MAEDIPGKVHFVLRKTGEAFEQVHPGSTDRFVAAISPAFDNLWAVLDRLAEEPILSRRRASPQPDAYMICWHLLWDACNSLVGAFTLFQRGHETDTLAVTRGVLERVACAIVLFDNPELVPRFNAEGLGSDFSTKAITPAGQVIGDLPRTWGLLSQLGVHIRRENVGTSFLNVVRGAATDQVEMVVGGRIPTSGEQLEAWGEMVDELCRVAEQILVPAPAQILFNERRVRAVWRRGQRQAPSEVM
jgi:hypothetical protein